MNEIVMYRSADKQTQLAVRFDKDSVWLSQQQMAELFSQTKQNISLHISNCFKEKELYQSSVVKESLTTAADGKSYKTKYYNLDVIISIGYRVKSKRGTQFRQWATQRLNEYLVKGYAINQKRLEERNFELRQLETGIHILKRAIKEEARDLDDARMLAELLERFSSGLSLLDDYDHESLDEAGRTKKKAVEIGSDEYRKIVDAMHGDFPSSLFGREKDDSFESSTRQIYQTFNGKELYPALEEKAATLLYLIVKNHSFTDGNKRIAAACFLFFLKRNGLLLDSSGIPIIGNDALAAMTLFIAVSKPSEMETVKKVIISILNRTAAD